VVQQAPTQKVVEVLSDPKACVEEEFDMNAFELTYVHNTAVSGTKPFGVPVGQLSLVKALGGVGGVFFKDIVRSGSPHLSLIVWLPRGTDVTEAVATIRQLPGHLGLFPSAAGTGVKVKEQDYTQAVEVSHGSDVTKEVSKFSFGLDGFPQCVDSSIVGSAMGALGWAFLTRSRV
jgi:hypothetical protein